MKRNITLTLAFCVLSLLSSYAQPNRRITVCQPGQLQTRQVVLKKNAPTIHFLQEAQNVYATPQEGANYALVEDFSLFTEGNEAEPSVNPVENPETGEIPAELTSVPGWYGDGVYQAGGTAYIGISVIDPGVTGLIETGDVDLSANNGAFVVHFRAKTTDGYSDIMNIISVDGENMDSYDVIFNQAFLTTEWKEFSIPLSRGVKRSRVQMYANYSTILLDDIKLECVGIVAPEPTGSSEYTGTEFVANWTPVDGSTKYLVSVYYETEEGNKPLFLDKETTETSMRVTGLDKNTIYYYSVKATDGTYISCPSIPTMAKINELATPKVPVISDVTATGFTATWEPVDNSNAYMPYISLVHQATQNEEYVILDTDFNKVNSTNGCDDPEPVASNYLDKMGLIDRADWIANNPVLTTGALGLFQGSVFSPSLDFSLGDGTVTIKANMKGRVGLSHAIFELRKDIRGSITVLDHKEITVTEEFAPQTITLCNGEPNSYIAIITEEDGFFYMDDLKVTKNLKANETIYLPMFTYETTELTYTVDDFEKIPGEKYAFAVVAAYINPNDFSFIMSHISDYAMLPDFTTGIANLEEGGVKVQIENGCLQLTSTETNAVTVYNSFGQSIANTIVENEKLNIVLPERGIYIVRIANKSFKIAF